MNPFLLSHDETVSFHHDTLFFIPYPSLSILHSCSLFLSAPASLITEPLESLGDSITTAVLLSWSKEIGDSVKEDDVIAIVETDKVRVILLIILLFGSSIILIFIYSAIQLFSFSLILFFTYSVILIFCSSVVLLYLIHHTMHQINHSIMTLPLTIAHSTMKSFLSYSNHFLFTNISSVTALHINRHNSPSCRK